MKLTAQQETALQFLHKEGPLSAARMGHLLGYAKGGHGAGGAVLRALENRRLAVSRMSNTWSTGGLIWEAVSPPAQLPDTGDSARTSPRAR